MSKSFAGNSGAPLEQRVSEHLTAQILSLRLSPGEHIVMDALADELGVSRLPVREALRNLAGTGLVELKPYRGAYVTDLGIEQLDQVVEVFEVRMRLEPWVAERAADLHTPEELARLDSALADGFAGLAARDPSAMNRAHHHFLRTMSRMARHDTLDGLLTPLHHRTMLAFVSVRVKVEPQGWEAHRIARDAIAGRDGAAAAAQVRDHLAEMIEALRLEGNVVPSLAGYRNPAAPVTRSRRSRQVPTARR